MFKNFINSIRNYFSFTKKERTGFYILSLILLLIVFSPVIFDLMVPSRNLLPPEDSSVLDSLVYLLEQENKKELFYFNPNTISKDSLLLLGISGTVANNWDKYRNAGGMFYDSTDIFKIYGFDEKIYLEILPFVIWPEISENRNFAERKSELPNEKYNEKPRASIIEPFDINSATKADLIKIFGIGEVLSERIIKYRDLLGGFVAKDQFQNVYGLKEDALENLKEYTYIGESFVPQTININNSEYKTILRHPYISKEITDKLFKERNDGKLELTDEQFKELINNDSIYFILLPYIEF